MVDPVPSDGESRAPRKHKSEQRNSRANTRDSHSGGQNGYHNERAPSSSHHERSKHPPQERDENHGDRRQNRHREDRSQGKYQEREKNKSRDRYKERDKHYEDRGHSRYEADRSPNHHGERDGYHKESGHPGYKERDGYHKESGHPGYKERDGYHKESGHPRYKERDGYYKESSHPGYEERDGYYKESSPPPYEERDHQHKERSRNRFDERERHQERYVQSVDRQGLSMNKKQAEYYYSSERSYPPTGPELQDLEYYEAEPEGGILDCHKCRYLCTGRACCQLVEVLLNMLILICCSVSYNSTGGYTGITNLGGIYYYQFGGAYSGFSGADGQKAQELDVQFYNLKLPTVTTSMAIGGSIMAFSCLTVLLGVLRVPWHWPIWLLVECGLDIVIAVGYMPALYFYFKYLQDAYNSQVCKDRETLYSSKGYQGFSCALHGADIAAVLFACMAIVTFFLSAVLAVKGFRTVRRKKRKPVNPLEF